MCGFVISEGPLETIISLISPKDLIHLFTCSRDIERNIRRTVYGRFIQDYVNKMRINTREECMHAAVMFDNARVLDWIRRSTGNRILNGRFCGTAAAYGCMNSLSWLRSNGCEIDSRACGEAARKGRLDVLSWLRERGWPWDETTAEAAARAGRVDVLEWLLFERVPPCPAGVTCARTAAENGNIDLLVWLREKRVAWDGSTIYEAARGRHEHIVQWARANDCPLDKKLHSGLFESVYDDDIDTLRVLHKYDCCSRFGSDICEYATTYGKDTILEWARDEGFSQPPNDYNHNLAL